MSALFKVRLTDPRVKNGQQRQDTYVVVARHSAEAIETLREESPSAFAYDPAVVVTAYEHRSIHLLSLSVKRPKAPHR